MPTGNPRSILIIKLSAIGDVVHTLPLLEVLRKNFPDARIDWLVEEEAAQIIEGHEGLDRMLVSGRKSWQKRLLRKDRRSEALREILQFLRGLRSLEYDLVIDMQGLFKSGLLTGLSRGRRKIGFTWAREGSTLFLTALPYFVDQYRQHAIERYLKTADILGCRVGTWQGRIPVRKSDEDRVLSLLQKNHLAVKDFVAVNPMARWRTKLWEPWKFARLAERVREDLGLDVVFTGGAADRPAIEEIRGKMRVETLNLAGLTGLKELAFLYTLCRVLITTDTGPMHIAAAMNCPVVALFGPTAPWRTGPYGDGHRVIREGMDCSPCFKKKCSHVSCMKGIKVDRVFDAVRERASRGPGILG
ncbi:MAG: lipopolysaccharide heptosyltransferase II [Deltaproteobacteria bacterium]|nr:lipopolysaccharide heptosyltransferase II [Deltaproteobacteria bacterium]